MSDKSTILLRCGAIGDLIQLSPFLSLYKLKNPHERLTLICGKSCEEVHTNNPHLDSIVTFNDRKIYHGNIFQKTLETFRIISELKKHSKCFILHRALSWQILPMLAGVRRISVLSDSFSNRMQNYSATFQLEVPDDIRCRFYPGATEIKIPEQPYITVAAGAGNIKYKDTSRIWRGYRELLRKLSDRGCRVILLGELEDSLSIKGIIDLCGKTNLSEAYHIIDNSKLFIGNDSGLLHLANCTDTEKIGIFTSTDPSEIFLKTDISLLLNPSVQQVLERIPVSANI